MKYLIELISKTGIAGAKPVLAPLESNVKLTSTKFDKTAGITNDVVLKDASPYQILGEKLMYTIITKPNISFAVQTLSQFM